MMNLKNLLFAISTLATSTFLFAQGNTNDFIQKKSYVSFEGEMIFSLANIEEPELADLEQNLRWSPVFNLAWHYNYDATDFFGLNIGLGIRNVGFIVKNDGFSIGNNVLDTESVGIDRKKYRTYNLGLPIGFKLGRLDQARPLFVFAGVEFEIPFHYKEKQFDGGDKLRKRTDWFSDRTTDFQQSVFVGIQLPDGFSLKAKYYLTEFFNSDFTETISAGEGSENVVISPYENFNANIVYLSVTWFPFQDLDYTLKKAQDD